MDRRDFLKTGSLVAAAGTTGGAAALAEGPMPAPVSGRGAREWVLAVPQSVAHPEVLTASHRLARRLTQVIGDDLSVKVTTTVEGGLEAVSTGTADLYLGLESHHAGWQPAFHLFSGLTLGAHLDMTEQQAWLAGAGAQDLWQDLSSRFGVIAFAAFQTGHSAGLVSDRLLAGPADLAGLRIACRGLAVDVLAAMGADTSPASPPQAHGAIMADGLDALEPVIGAATGLAHWSYGPGPTAGGWTLALGLRTSLWAKLAGREQAAIEAIAGESLSLSQSLAVVRQTSLTHADRLRRWPVHTALPAAIVQGIEAATADALERIAAHDRLARRIVDSHRAFRAALGGQASDARWTV